MTYWKYGLVKEESGKIRLWEIIVEKNYIWGHKAVFSWVIKELHLVIKDLWSQYKNHKQLFDGKELDKGTNKFLKTLKKYDN